MKLVRDNIPEIILANDGRSPEWRNVSSQTEHRGLLLEKIIEEYAEYNEAERLECKTEELSDISEVLYSFTVLDDYTEQHLQRTQRKQRPVMGLEGASADALNERFNLLHAELAASPSSSERLEKLAGLLECVYGLSEAVGVSIHKIEDVRLEKRKARGSFIGGVVLLSCIPNDGSA